MARGRQHDAWDRTAALLAMLANIHRDRKKRPAPYRPCDFHPLEKPSSRGLRLGKGTIRMLRPLMVKS